MNLKDSLSHLAKEKFDVILSDLVLPDSIGIETIESVLNFVHDINN